MSPLAGNPPPISFPHRQADGYFAQPWQRFFLGLQNALVGPVDLATDVTGVLPIVHGGTSATTAAGARAALGLVIGVDVEAWDAFLDALAALATTGILVRTGAGAAATRTLTAGSGISISNGDGVSGNPVITATGGGGGTWTLLTNGDVAAPELIFAGGDVISIFLP